MILSYTYHYVAFYYNYCIIMYWGHAFHEGEGRFCGGARRGSRTCAARSLPTRAKGAPRGLPTYTCVGVPKERATRAGIDYDRNANGNKEKKRSGPAETNAPSSKPYKKRLHAVVVELPGKPGAAVAQSEAVSSRCPNARARLSVFCRTGSVRLRAETTVEPGSRWP